MDKTKVGTTVRLLTMLKKIATLTLVSAISSLALAAGALAATPQQIYRDAADGKLDQRYSPSDLRRAAHNATLSGYGNQVINIIIKNVNKNVNKQVNVFAPPRLRKPQGPSPVPPRRVPPRGMLPFTGSDLATFTSLGIALMAGGFLLRLMGRKPLRSI